MYPVTNLFQTKIKETARFFKLSVQIQHSAGVLTLTDADVLAGSLQVTESSQLGDNFTIGGVVANTLNLEIRNRTAQDGFFLVDNILIPVDDMLHPVDWYYEYSSINFEGATIIPQVALQVDDINDVWEYVPLGRFVIDEVQKNRTSIRIKAIDGMIELDKPYDLSNLSYPANLYQIYMNICNIADVTPGTVNFTNQDYIVNSQPEGDYTLRDILGYVAELSGSFARFNRNNALELAWYSATGLSLNGSNRFDFKPREDTIRITGIRYTPDENNEEDVTYISGTSEYVVDLSNNPLLQANGDVAIAAIYEKIKGTTFIPYESRWQGNPAIQPGDIIVQTDRAGVAYNTLVTHSTYKYRGASNLAARGMPIKAKRYTGSTNKKIAEIKRRVEKDFGDKLTDLEQAQLNVTELIANMLGGYVINADDALYIADNPDINIAQKIWKWGLGGFGFSSTGKDGPYTTGISADGTIVAMLVAANIITADMIKTGMLSSTDGSSWLNLDDGSFNFKNILTYANGLFTINDPSVIKSTMSYNGATIDSTSGIRVNFNNGGHAQMGDGSILVQHADGSHTVIDGRGISRLFSIPIFESLGTDVDIIDNFETGLLADTRVSLAQSEAQNNDVRDPADFITITGAQKYAGTYGLQVRTPDVGLILTGYDPDTHIYTGYYLAYINCVFLNYMPTKDTTFSLKYKVSSVPTQFSGKLIVQDVDYPSEPVEEFSLTSTTWTEISTFLTGNHTYRIRVVMQASDNFDSESTIDSDAIMYAYFDDIVWEMDVNESVIVGYEEGTKPYNDFTYIRKDEILTGTTQKQITLPDYFRGMTFDVLITQLENYATPTLLSINNKVPSFTVSGENTKFMYTVIINS